MSSVIVHSTPLADSVATIAPKWLPWLRGAWILIVANAVLVFALLVFLTRGFSDNPPARVANGLHTLGWSGDTFFWFHTVLMVLDFAFFLAVGCFIFLVRPQERMAFFASVFLIAFGAENAYPFAPEFAASWANIPLLFRVTFFTNNIFAWAFIAAFFALFPDGRFVPKWTRYVALYVFIFSFLYGIFPSTFGAPEGWILVLVLASATLIFGGGFLAQVQRYRHYASPLQKQQIKWLIYALALLVFFYVAYTAIVYVVLPPTQVSEATSVATELSYFAANLTLLLMPLAIATAILRYRLWDIDILIRRTLTYAILSAFLVLIYFSSIVALQRVFTLLTNNTQNEIVTVVSTLAIAALFIPLRSRIQEIIDRRFNRKKYDAQKVLTEFAETVRDETNLEELVAGLVQVVQDTMQPKSISIWMQQEQSDVKTQDHDKLYIAL